MKLSYYLDYVDGHVFSMIRQGTISKCEGLDLQSKAYEFENISFGMNWFNKKMDDLLGEDNVPI